MNTLQATKAGHRLVLISTIFLSGALAALVLAPLGSAQNVSFKLASGSPVAVGSSPITIATGDFNGDNIPDLAVANAKDNSVTILLGDGHGGFSSSGTFIVNTNPTSAIPLRTCGVIVTCTSFPLAIAVGDFNNDNKPDLVVTNIPVNDECAVSAGLFGTVCSQVGILLADPKNAGSFLSPSNFDSGGNIPIAVAVANFNNDKDGNGVPKLDLAVVNLNSNNVLIFLGNGGGGFGAKTSITVGTHPTAVAVGDFNGDGNTDLAVANADDGTISIALGKGDGTFQTPTTFNVGGRPVSIAVGDVNGDKNADLVVANLLDSTVTVLFGDGTGSFPSSRTLAVGRNPSSVVLGDFNSDGKVDLAVVNRYSGTVAVLLGNGDGTFAPYRSFPTGNSAIAAVTGNFGGGADLAVTNAADNSVSVLLNDTDTTPPVTTAMLAPPPNGNGWNNTSVAVMLKSSDSEPSGSGVREIHYTIGSGTPVVVPGGSATVPFPSQGIFAMSYFGVDNAGNMEAAHSLAIQIDLTPPTITSSQSPPTNGAGWNNSNVTVSFSCSDDFSGVASCNGTAAGGLSGNPLTVTTEGAGQVVTGTATDNAGNTATTSRTINLDKTPPVLTMPTFAPSYLVNSKLTLNFGAADALSGVATIQATLNGTPVTSSSTVTLTHLATNTFTLTAVDVAGNTSTQTATFQVVYNFIGFLPPIPNDGTGLFKLGSTIPVKFQLTDANGTSISTAVGHLTIQMISNNTLVGTPIDATASGNADVGDLFRFDGTQYVFNWSTKPVSTGTWQLQAQLDDGTVHTVVMGTK